MKKIYSTKSTLLTGTLFLTLAGILTRIIGFFYRIFLSRTIGAEGLGIYQLIAPVTAICFAFTAAGIQTSISKFVSMEVGRKNDAGAKTYLSIGLFISLCLSTLCSFFLYHYADFIAVSWLGDKRCTPLLAVLSFSFIPCCIHACINGYYYGLKKTAVPSLCQLTEQFARVGSVYLMYQIAVSEGFPWSSGESSAARRRAHWYRSVFSGSPMETGAPPAKAGKISIPAPKICSPWQFP